MRGLTRIPFGVIFCVVVGISQSQSAADDARFFPPGNSSTTDLPFGRLQPDIKRPVVLPARIPRSDHRLSGFITEGVPRNGDSSCPQNEYCGHSTPSGCASWREAGTLFRWSFSEATGGPNLAEPLVTDRPDFTEASSTVGRGVAQVEFGYTLAYDSDGTASVRSQSIGEPLLRYGIVANWLEFRAALFPIAERTVESGVRNSTAGTADLYLGLKIGLTPGDGILPEMSLIPQMTVPTGSNAFSNDQVLPGVNWIYGWEITDKFSTAGSSQINRVPDDGTGRSYLEFAQSWTAAFSLTDKLGMYTEWFALFPHSADTAKPKHFFNFGFTYLISNDIQWDIRYGVGLNSAADDYFVGTGLSIRFR